MTRLANVQDSKVESYDINYSSLSACWKERLAGTTLDGTPFGVMLDGTPFGVHALGVINVRVKLTFPEHLIKQPLMGRLVREFDVLPNIRRANITETVGWIVCELGGEQAQVEKALDWLTNAGVQVDRLGDVVES